MGRLQASYQSDLLVPPVSPQIGQLWVSYQRDWPGHFGSRQMKRRRGPYQQDMLVPYEFQQMGRYGVPTKGLAGPLRVPTNGSQRSPQQKDLPAPPSPDKWDVMGPPPKVFAGPLWFPTNG